MLSGARKHFLTGLLVFLPAVLTLVVLNYLLRVANAWIVDPLYQILPFEVDRKTAVFFIKIGIVATALGAICLIGWAAEILFVKKLLEWGERLLERLPLVNLLYTTLKEAFHILLGQRQEFFGSVVLVQYPRAGMWSVGFVTKTASDELKDKTGKDLVRVFIPSTPNIATGFFVLVPPEEVVETSIPMEEAVRIVVSGGAVGNVRARAVGARNARA
jgi:uncharacterized membrane protein